MILNTGKALRDNLWRTFLLGNEPVQLEGKSTLATQLQSSNILKSQSVENAMHLLLCLNPSGTMINNLPANAGDTRDVGSIPGWGRSPGVGNGNPLQHFFLENSMDIGAWQAIVHRVTKSWTWLSKPTHALNKMKVLLIRNFRREDS